MYSEEIARISGETGRDELTDREMRKAMTRANLRLLKKALRVMVRKDVKEAMKNPIIEEAVIKSREEGTPQAKHKRAMVMCIYPGPHGDPVIRSGEKLDACIERVSGVPVIRSAEGMVVYDEGVFPA